MSSSECVFCRDNGGELIWRDGLCRVVRPDESDHPGLCRVVLHAHVKEMTDLAPHERTRVMQVVFEVETALRALLHPDKVNLASLGNMVPHVHWHVIPRFTGDAHFPGSIWSARQRASEASALPADFSASLRARLTAALPA